jgi:hypothetical protein
MFRSLGKERVCREPSRKRSADEKHLANNYFVESFSWPLANSKLCREFFGPTLGKHLVFRELLLGCQKKASSRLKIFP